MSDTVKDLSLNNSNDLIEENFKSCFARSVAVNSQRNSSSDSFSVNCEGDEDNKHILENSSSTQDSQFRFKKNYRPHLEENRRFSCGSIIQKTAPASFFSQQPKRNEIPVESIYNQNKIETLQWQIKEIEKSREMYKAVLKQVVTFLEKAYVSLEHLGARLNTKKSVTRSKSEHYIFDESDNCSVSSKRSLVEEPFNNWNPSQKRQDCNPNEVPPEKLSQEAFRLLRTAQSLLSTQEPKLSSSDSIPDVPSDVEFLQQLAKEFPCESAKPQRSSSFNLSPKLILPESEISISMALNRKLSLQLNEYRRNSESSKNFKNSAGSDIDENDCYFLGPRVDKLERNSQTSDSIRSSGNEFTENKFKCVKEQLNPGSLATASISSTEDESGFSSMNSFQDIGLPLINSTGLEDVSARSVLLKSMLHNNCDTLIEGTILPLLESSSTKTQYLGRTCEKYKKPMDKDSLLQEEKERCKLNDIKLWQKCPLEKPSTTAISSISNSGLTTPLSSRGNHQRWHSTPEQKDSKQLLKVLWV
ncbi:uncharacterized protein LOC126747536 [Anthonomus grandis grandis]|uniref:uncharacterized protein LOC126747536 n=1 Tax=Anthonomus grandis grandis TaxID=2921223 RepID=UPI002166AAB4|nr:uncharacterized protein LOC126747536 [Anthonomus grandis grandis]